MSSNWDVIVIGSGFGGATAALRAAQAGLKVLILERGDWTARDEDDWNPRKILIDQRYQSDVPSYIRQYKQKTHQETHLAEVVGGNSVFFGGAAFRFREKDFNGWPITYDEFEPYYVEAEELLGIAGNTEGPHQPRRSKSYPRPSIERNIPAKRIAKAGEKLKLQPATIPMAIDFKRCEQCHTCDGFPCKIKAKNDADISLIQKALKLGVEVKPRSIVESLVQKDGRITAVKVVDRGTQESKSYAAKTFVLAAGALNSPAIVLNSGLARGHAENWVGKYLMRHCNGIVGSVFPFQTNPQKIFHKQVCFFDFYEDVREKMNTSMGIIQDIYMPDKEVVGHFTPFGFKTAATGLSNYIQNLLCLAEDDAQESNGVTLGESKDQYGIPHMKVEHHYTADDFYRRDYLLSRAKKVLRAAGGLMFKTYDIDTFSHAVGTLRFGNTPAEGVLDKNCRFHDFQNLYALDGSFFPTSGGVNPSLSIVANSLRCSKQMIKELQ